MIIFGLYLVCLFCLTISILWIISSKTGLEAWFTNHPVNYYIVGFVETFFIIGFLDFYYLENISDVLVEANGLFFDLIVFGILFAIYEQIKHRKDQNEKETTEIKLKIDRYKEELNDYKGWMEEASAYRIAGIVNRLIGMGVSMEEIDLTRLNLSKIKSEQLIEAIQYDKVQYRYSKKYNKRGSITSPQTIPARLDDVNLRWASLDGVDLVGASLNRVNLNDSNLKNINFRGAKMEGINFSYTVFENVDLSWTNLDKSSFYNSKFKQVKFNNSNLTDSNLETISFENIDLTGVTLLNCKVSKPNWFDILKEKDVKGICELERKYIVSPKPISTGFPMVAPYYLIKEI